MNNQTVTRPLKAFLCHASGDKPPVREFYKRLVFEGVDAWLDKEKLLPGQDWRVEIPRAVHEADVVIVFLSNKSISKEGYVQKEIKFALDIAEEKPEGTIFLIPARLEECVVPERLSRWHWVDLYEENGFAQLLRSLKLRADAVRATVEPSSYEDTDKEVEHKLEQLYTEGLAAFYTEEWDKACQRFQMILSEHPNHKNAAEKLTEAEKQRSLAKLYAQAAQGHKAENWSETIQALEELLQKSAEYKDAAQLLRNAKKQKRLKELYAEAKALHAAQKWQAVLKVFEQIFLIEHSYPDPDSLLASARKEVAELQRLSSLNDQYSLALRGMESGNWYEARRLLETVHKSQTGFLETEKLLKSVENQILKVEETRRQNDQINTLYEQAHGLLRSKKWRNALDKMEEIRKLDDQFLDKDGISEKAKNVLTLEEQDAQRQNELAAMYAESARLLKEGKYQEALDKWQEVKTVDPKYPDRQWVQRTARKKLSSIARPVRAKFRYTIIGSNSIKIVSVILFFSLLGAGMIALSKSSADSTSLMRDNFNSILYNGSFNHNKWTEQPQNPKKVFYQQGGRLVLNQPERDIASFLLVKDFEFSTTSITLIQADLMVDTIEDNASIQLHALTTRGRFICGLQASIRHCFYESNYGGPVTQIKTVYSQNNGWHTFYIEINPFTHMAFFHIDGDQVGSSVLAADEQLTGVIIGVWNSTGLPAKGYIDNVSIETRGSP
ncbi:TIR domain-containing protein [Candidatus Villigracilis affinis]|uniref:TIR domain-containing protein n=1 Tax=Candidatus Villigracilis affinis TaxID=3140682 RepID=UPI001B5309B3|nr:TIR domain-containing protein [Anaerolineales bacterium]MBL0344348.1 TIR domain-containing protein [Anaerolineales bacterium]MBP8047347.1 TIR domain-containing protein [Anaerolineales bacterium]